jgi:hypothetical protein
MLASTAAFADHDDEVVYRICWNPEPPIYIADLPEKLVAERRW